MWKNLIQHLADQGVSQYATAKAAGVNQSTICRLAAGEVEPRYSVAMALIELGGGVAALHAKGLITGRAANDADTAQAAQQGVA